MKILSVHNQYQTRGGEDVSRESEEQMLREHGHTVDVYTDHNKRVAELGTVKTALKTVWSHEAYQKVSYKLRQADFDVMHVQNFFPLISPSVYYAAKRAGVPVVQSLRNYRLFCLNGLFFRDGHVCEDCFGKAIPWPGVAHGCYRGSRAGSSVVASMLVFHRLRQTWLKQVDVFIALTDFVRQKFIESGFPAERIVVKPNFLASDPGPGEGSGNYALFVSRLSEEKGIPALLAAWERVPKSLPLKIVGTGPLSKLVQDAAQRMPNVEWLGPKSSQEVYDLMGEAKFLVFPSEWYETFGRVAVEAFAKGTPVIAANIGAIAELIDHKRTGLFFKPGDASDLTAQVEWLLSHPAELACMRQEARAEYEAKYTADKNYSQLIEIYQRAIDLSR